MKLKAQIRVVGPHLVGYSSPMPRVLLPLLLMAFALPAQALKLASTSPQVTELLFDLGKGADLVAVSAFSHYPKEAKALPELGTLFFPSIERALSLGTEAVAFDQMNASSAFAKAADSLGLRRFEFTMDGAESFVADSRRFLKEAYGETSNARLDRLMPCLSAYRPARRFRFLALTWAQPPIAFGAPTFLSDVLTRLGGENLVSSHTKAQFPRLSVEWILAREVDYVFYLTDFPDTVPEVKATVAGWWPKRTPEVIILGGDHFARGGFAPIRAADTLSFVQPKTGWKECLEGAK